jgi:dTDP-glucose 4,6-dehydratase
VSPSDNPLAADLDQILAHTKGLWEELRGKRIFVTGGTGFIGCWLLESFVWANDRLELGASALALTRNVASFQEKVPHLATHASIQLLQGDVRFFEFPNGEFSHIIHAATEAPTKSNDEEPLLKFDTIVRGTWHTLEFARRCGATKLLLTSSGAVYGKQPPDLSHIPESYQGAPDPTDPHFVNGGGKRAAEMLCALYARQFGIEPKIARCFAFVGPYLQLDFPYAIANFFRDGLHGGPILVTGDGRPYRSYMYAADLAIWLWTILFRGEPCRPYNVGSEQSIMLGEFAKIVAGTVQPQVEVHIAMEPPPGRPVERYVPSTERARVELGLHQSTDLLHALHRTIDWYASRRIETDRRRSPCQT